MSSNTLLDHTSISFAKGRRTLLSSTQASCIMDSMMSTFCEQDLEVNNFCMRSLRWGMYIFLSSGSIQIRFCIRAFSTNSVNCLRYAVAKSRTLINILRAKILIVAL